MIKQKNTLHIPPDRLQTRGDHSYSLQDAEKFRAIETLKKARLLIPFTELSTYHGRVAHVSESEPWSIDPTYANGGNDSGNNNLNARSTLYTGTQAHATEMLRPSTIASNRL